MSLGLARVRPAVAAMLGRTGLEAQIGAENIYPSVRSAVRAHVGGAPRGRAVLVGRALGVTAEIGLPAGSC